MNPERESLGLPSNPPGTLGPGAGDMPQAPSRWNGDEAAAPAPARVEARRRSPYRLHFILFILTIMTTLTAGAFLTGANPFQNPADLLKGVPFSFTLMAILLTHEMGHYLTARHYGVPATLPYFIPAPPIPGTLMIGTFGAFIRMQAPIFQRAAILEIGAAGPIAGFVVAIAATVVGLRLSEIVPPVSETSIRLGEPLVFTFLSHLMMDVPEGMDLLLHPVAFAAWIGLFVTALNLIPIGQLDGGHVTYALFKERHTAISIAMVGGLLYMGYIGWPGWYLWAVLVTILGVRHPPMTDPEAQLAPRQKLIGWLSLIIFVLTFMPNPFMLG